MKQKPLKPYFVEDAPVKSLHIDGYEISFDPLKSSLSSIPKEHRTAYLSLLEEAQITPKGCLPKALKLKEVCNASPEVDNLLTYLHLKHRQVAKAEKLIEEGFFKYPSYFIAKVNYADQALRKKQPHKVVEIFPSLELKENELGRTRYHVTEYRSFMLLMSRYQLALGQKPSAIEFYLKAQKVDPVNINVIALEKVLFPRFNMKKLFLRFYKLFSLNK